MNRLTRKAVLLFALYLVVSIGLTLIVIKVQSNQKGDINATQDLPARVTDLL